VVDRYFLIAISPTCILVAISVIQLARHRSALPLILVLFATVSASVYGVATTEWKEDWRSVVAYLAQNAGANDAVVLVPDILRFPFTYYYDGPLPVHGVTGDLADWSEIAREFEQAASSAHLWVIQAERFAVSDQTSTYIAAEYGADLLGCKAFGGFYGVDVCVYATGSS
jgi:hypothetical protein